jgi:hypothetical protein
LDSHYVVNDLTGSNLNEINLKMVNFLDQLWKRNTRSLELNYEYKSYKYSNPANDGIVCGS